MAAARAFLTIASPSHHGRKESIGIREDAEGVLRIGPSRVTLDTVVEQYWAGLTVESLLSKYPTLDAADVLAALATYLRERQYFDAYLEKRRSNARELRTRETTREESYRANLAQRARELGRVP